VKLSEFYYYADERCVFDRTTGKPYADGICDRRGDYAVECGEKMHTKKNRPKHPGGRYYNKQMGR